MKQILQYILTDITEVFQYIPIGIIQKRGLHFWFRRKLWLFIWKLCS